MIDTMPATLKQTSLFDFDEPVAVIPATEPKQYAEDFFISEVAEEPRDLQMPAHDKPKGKRGRKSIAEMASSVLAVNVPDDAVLFSKSYYSIGKVAEMFGENISLIRHWEKEFDILKPRKNGKGDRFFRPEDIKNIQVLHHLLREKKYTIEGAKDFMKRNKKAEQNFLLINQLNEVKAFLNEMRALI